jgi:hypothetical protein
MGHALSNAVAVSPASLWRVLKQAGLLSRRKGTPSRKPLPARIQSQP